MKAWPVHCSLRVLLTLSILLLSTFLSSPLGAAQLEEEEPISMDLKEADLGSVLQAFASILGAELELHPEVSGDVTVSVQKIPWAMVLNQVCRIHQLNCELLSGEQPILRVRPTQAVPDFPLPAGYAETVDMTLRGAELSQVLQAFGAIARRDLDLEEGISGKVSVNLYAVPWPVLLLEMCSLGDCAVQWGDPIRVLPRSGGSAARRGSLELRDLPLEAALQNVTEQPIFGPLGVPEVKLEGQLSGRVSVKLEGALWPEMLDAVLQPLGYAWEFHYGSPSHIKVLQPKEKKASKPAASPKLRSAAAASQKGLDLGLTLRSVGADPLRGLARFNWTAPLRSLEEGGWGFQVSWIPLAPEHGLLLPMIGHCKGPVHFFDPLTLPLEEPWQGRFQGVLGEIDPLPEGLEQRAGREPCEELSLGGFDVRLLRSGAGPTKVAEVLLPGPPGSYVLLHPAGDGEPSMAVLSLDGFGAEREIGLLYIEEAEAIFERYSVDSETERAVPVRIGGEGEYELSIRPRT